MCSARSRLFTLDTVVFVAAELFKYHWHWNRPPTIALMCTKCDWLEREWHCESLVQSSVISTVGPIFYHKRTTGGNRIVIFVHDDKSTQLTRSSTKRVATRTSVACRLCVQENNNNNNNNAAISACLRLKAPSYLTYFGEVAYLLSRIWANFMLVRIMLPGTGSLHDSWYETYSQMYDNNLSSARNDSPSAPTCRVYLGNLDYPPFSRFPVIL
jgi:hypothetical protein